MKLVYIKEVKASYNSYKQARDLRREQFGPTLSDMLYDISKTTVKAGINTVKNSKDKLKDYAKQSESKTVKKFLEYYRKGREFAQKSPKDFKNLFIGKSDLDKQGSRISTPNYSKSQRNSVKLELERLRKENEIMKQQLQNNQTKEELPQTKTTKPKEKDIKKQTNKNVESEYIENDRTEFAKFYSTLNHKERQNVINNYNQGKSYDEILNESENMFIAKHGGAFGTGVAVFWQTLRDGDRLSRGDMFKTMSDIDELSRVDNELAQLEKRKAELMNRKEEIEDKYFLVTPKQRIEENFKSVLQASEKMIKAQIDDAIYYKDDTSVLEDNLRRTQEELASVTAKVNNRNPFDFYEEDEREERLRKEFEETIEENLVKEGEVIEEEFTEEIDFEEIEKKAKKITQENTFDEEDFTKQIAEINDNVEKRKLTRDWSIKH